MTRRRGRCCIDSSTAPVELSLNLVEGLHARWVRVLESLTSDEWQRGFKHAKSAGR
jgi:hypothetical protein